MSSIPYDAWAPWYDIGEGDRSTDLAYYLSLVEPPTSSVLELGCGTGVIASAMRAKLSGLQPGMQIRVVGVDQSAAMLALARERDPAVDWRLGDLSRAPGEDRFDLVFCAFNTLQFMLRDEDLLRAFVNARKRLDEGGRFAFDLYQPNFPYLRIARQDSLGRRVEHLGRQLEIREDASYHEDSRILELQWRLRDLAAPEEILAATSFRIRQYPAGEILRLLDCAGLRVLERYGDLKRSPFSAESKKQVLVCACA